MSIKLKYVIVLLSTEIILKTMNIKGEKSVSGKHVLFGMEELFYHFWAF